MLQRIVTIRGGTSAKSDRLARLARGFTPASTSRRGAGGGAILVAATGDRGSRTTLDAHTALLLDMRIPFTFSVEDCRLIGEIVTDRLARIRGLLDAETAAPPRGKARSPLL